jgi:hypothetical protein
MATLVSADNTSAASKWDSFNWLICITNIPNHVI